jgi:hypothetical protein
LKAIKKSHQQISIPKSSIVLLAVDVVKPGDAVFESAVADLGKCEEMPGRAIKHAQLVPDSKNHFARSLALRW